MLRDVDSGLSNWSGQMEEVVAHLVIEIVADKLARQAVLDVTTEARRLSLPSGVPEPWIVRHLTIAALRAKVAIDTGCDASCVTVAAR